MPTLSVVLIPSIIICALLCSSCRCQDDNEIPIPYNETDQTGIEPIDHNNGTEDMENRNQTELTDNSLLPLQDSAREPRGYPRDTVCSNYPHSPHYRSGSGDDVEDFDFIRNFKLDRGSRYPEVYRIRGSNGVQTAYRILESARNLNIPAWQMFPHGLPSSFTFLCTYRTRSPVRTPWRLVIVTQDQYSGRPSFEISLDPETGSVRLAMPHVFDRTVTFDGVPASLFDQAWHKVQLSVSNYQVRLFIDCKEHTRRAQYGLNQYYKGGTGVNATGTICLTSLNTRETVPVSC
uniref:Collagen alpha-1(IX) chain n=1 Tax=Cacopsylla melanoneura TaxID=428564 RepID=A0A8D9EGS2_9HEMI